MKCLSMCSSRIRPTLMKRMVDSFNITRRGNTDLAVYIAETDPHIEEYRKITSELPNNIFIFGEYRYPVSVLNYLSTELFPDYDFYHQVNDDMIFKTEGWDIIMVDTIIQAGGWSIACVNDGIDPTWSMRAIVSEMLSGNIIKTLGFFQCPVLRGFLGDIYMREFLAPIVGVIHLSNILIDHVCWHDGVRGFGARKAPDDNDNWMYSYEEETYARAAWDEWHRSGEFTKNKQKLLDAIK